VYFIQVSSHMLTSLVNPGIPSKENICPADVASNGKVNVANIAGYENHKYCKTCNILVPNNRNVNHCDECDICIEGI
jgi:hypothetical protein